MIKILCTRNLKGNNSSRPRGFTLIEMMVVLGIIAGVLVIVVIPRAGQKNNELKATARRLKTISKQLHAYAKLQNLTYRLVIDMKDGKTSETPHQYWVEVSSQSVLLRSGDDEDEPIEVDEEGNPIDPGGFQPAVKILRRPQELPGGLFFESVELGTRNQPVTFDRAYIHYLPQGLVEESAIHLKFNDDLQWTIAIHPLTGQADVILKNVPLKEIRSQ